MFVCGGWRYDWGGGFCSGWLGRYAGASRQCYPATSFHAAFVAGLALWVLPLSLSHACARDCASCRAMSTRGTPKSKSRTPELGEALVKGMLSAFGGNNKKQAASSDDEIIVPKDVQLKPYCKKIASLTVKQIEFVFRNLDNTGLHQRDLRKLGEGMQKKLQQVKGRMSSKVADHRRKFKWQQRLLKLQEIMKGGYGDRLRTLLSKVTGVDPSCPFRSDGDSCLSDFIRRWNKRLAKKHKEAFARLSCYHVCFLLVRKSFLQTGCQALTDTPHRWSPKAPVRAQRC